MADLNTLVQSEVADLTFTRDCGSMFSTLIERTNMNETEYLYETYLSWHTTSVSSASDGAVPDKFRTNAYSHEEAARKRVGQLASPAKFDTIIVIGGPSRSAKVFEITAPVPAPRFALTER